MPASAPARLGILLSGEGSTYGNLVRALAAAAGDRLVPTIAVVVSSRAHCAGAAMATANGHALVVAAAALEVTTALRAHAVDWVVMCGWMRFWDPPGEFQGRTLNIHPSLLPAYGGQGMYGRHVHAAVLAHREVRSGCSVHLVSGGYDTGAILAQQEVPVLAQDSVESLQARVQAAERELYPRVILAATSGNLSHDGSRWQLHLP